MRIFDIALYDLSQAFGLLWVALQPGPRYDAAEGETVADFKMHSDLVNRCY